jgi:hypothetical protein
MKLTACVFHPLLATIPLTICKKLAQCSVALSSHRCTYPIHKVKQRTTQDARSKGGLLGIWDDADLLVYAGDGSLGDGAMVAGVYCGSDGRLLSSRIGQDEEGASSTRPETGSAWLALSDALGKPHPLVYLSDSKH